MFLSRLLTLGLACKVLTVAAGVKDLWGQRHQAQEPVSAAGDCQATATATNAKTNAFAVTTDDIAQANSDGFFFENPETDCKYASQPFIYNGFKSLETSPSGTQFASLIREDVDFQVMGHHPLAGIYHDRIHFFINAIYRLSMTYQPDTFRASIIGIHGGCDQEWSVQEVNFRVTANVGNHHDLVNVWITRWNEEGQINQVRTYVDAVKVGQLLRENEPWTNASSHTDRPDFLPGPAGMPNMTYLEQVMAEIDRSHHQGLDH